MKYHHLYGVIKTNRLKIAVIAAMAVLLSIFAVQIRGNQVSVAAPGDDAPAGVTGVGTGTAADPFTAMGAAYIVDVDGMYWFDIGGNEYKCSAN